MDADLYGDLDLEELDATALEEELVEPPEDSYSSQGQSSHQQASQPQAQQPQQYQQGGQQQAPAQGSSQQPFQGGGGGGGYGQQGGFQQQQAPQNPEDRLKSDAQDEGKMFIGGLNWETTDEGLKDYMSRFGHIDACTIMRDPTGRSRGFAFLTYSDPASVDAVLKEVHHLNGKQIDPKRAIPRAEHERTAKVFVGGLAPAVTSEALKDFLGEFGQVMDATVMFDKESGRSKGFAFATFADEEAVGRAMQGSGRELMGKQIEIKKAQPRGAGTLPNKFSGGNQPGGGRFNPMGGAGGMGGMGGMSAGGFDPNAMSMMYANMMKSMGGGGMMGGGGFDPNAMAMMYANMAKSMGGMANAPAINPNMGMRMGNMGGMGGMGMMGMGGMGMMGMGGMGGMGGGMGNMGNMGGMGMGGGRGGGNSGGSGGGRPVPSAPRGPAAMRGPGSASGGSDAGGSGVATPMSQSQQGQGGPGAQRYSTQGNARSRPY